MRLRAYPRPDLGPCSFRRRTTSRPETAPKVAQRKRTNPGVSSLCPAQPSAARLLHSWYRYEVRLRRGAMRAAGWCGVAVSASKRAANPSARRRRPSVSSECRAAAVRVRVPQLAASFPPDSDASCTAVAYKQASIPVQIVPGAFRRRPPTEIISHIGPPSPQL